MLGKVAVFGSGEISPTGRKVHDFLFSKLDAPVKVAILETPAGFQPNVEVVALEIKEFVEHSLQNYHPQIETIKARRAGLAGFDPNDPKIVAPILSANYIFAGPGSPTYTYRNLNNTRLFKYLLKRHQEGATISLASAAAIAFGTKTLPVYEIFKAGEDLRWEEGLDFFGKLGLPIVIVTHFNNKEGGEKLDTSRAYMGVERFDRLLAMLPKGLTVLGIDEQTACIFDFESEKCLVMGKGGVTVIKGEQSMGFDRGSEFSFEKLK